MTFARKPFPASSQRPKLVKNSNNLNTRNSSLNSRVEQIYAACPATKQAQAPAASPPPSAPLEFVDQHANDGHYLSMLEQIHAACQARKQAPEAAPPPCAPLKFVDQRPNDDHYLSMLERIRAACPAPKQDQPPAAAPPSPIEREGKQTSPQAAPQPPHAPRSGQVPRYFTFSEKDERLSDKNRLGSVVNR
jgi:hypothetical protein